MIPGSGIGEMEPSLVCFGATEPVSHNYTYTCLRAYINSYITAGSGKTVLAYGISSSLSEYN